MMGISPLLPALLATAVAFCAASCYFLLLIVWSSAITRQISSADPGCNKGTEQAGHGGTQEGTGMC